MVHQQSSPSSLPNATRPGGKPLYRDSHDVFAEPLTTLGGWDEIYREDFSGRPLPQRAGLNRRDQCVTKMQGSPLTGSAGGSGGAGGAEKLRRASVKERLALVKQRLNALIDVYLRPGESGEDQSAAALEGSLSRLVEGFEGARAKSLQQLMSQVRARARAHTHTHTQKHARPPACTHTCLRGCVDLARTLLCVHDDDVFACGVCLFPRPLPPSSPSSSFSFPLPALSLLLLLIIIRHSARA